MAAKRKIHGDVSGPTEEGGGVPGQTGEDSQREMSLPVSTTVSEPAQIRIDHGEKLRRYVTRSSPFCVVKVSFERTDFFFF